MASRTRVTAVPPARSPVVSFAAPRRWTAEPSGPARVRPAGVHPARLAVRRTIRYSQSYSPRVSIERCIVSFTRARSSGCTRALKAWMLRSNVEES
jgi:hypothetical protein